MKSVRLLVVDDSPDFLHAAPALLSVHPRAEVVGVARTAAEALRLAAILEPDLVVMDLIMPAMEGIAATRRMRALPAPPDVVVATFYNSVEFERLALEAGAAAFVSKDRLIEEVFALIDARQKGPGEPPAGV